MHVCVWGCVPEEGKVSGDFYGLPSCFLRWHLSLNLKLAVPTRLAGEQVPGIYLFLGLQSAKAIPNFL